MPIAPASFDLVVIGGGPAGVIGATTAAFFGKSVALVDAQTNLGGAGINTGTVPSKTLRETALAMSGMKSRKLYGVDLSLRREATIADLLVRERHVKAGFNASISQRLAHRRVNVYCGNASFIDPHTVRVSEELTLHGANILIATGSSPLRPSTIFPIDHPAVNDSDTILQLDRLPKSMAVIGAGVIGSEYACTFAAMGTQVHLIDGRSVLLPFLDAELSQALAAAMTRNGITFHWNQKVQVCTADQSSRVTLTLTSGEIVRVDAVLVAAGRKSNTHALNLPAAGVPVGERGLLNVDEQFRTAVPHIYAAGDVIGFPALASTSMEQARRAMMHAFNLGIRAESARLLPSGIYTIPEASTVGETEQSLQKAGVEYVIGRACYRDNARGRIIGDDDGFLKLLFRRSDMKLLGVHVLGEQATEVVHIGLMAMLTGSTAAVFDEACFNVPTLGQLYKFAALDAVHGLSASARSE